MRIKIYHQNFPFAFDFTESTKRQTAITRNSDLLKFRNRILRGI